MMFYLALCGLIFNLLLCLIVTLMTNGIDYSFIPRLYVDGPSYIQGALTMIKNNEWFFTVGDIYHSSATQIIYSYLLRIFSPTPLTIKCFNYLLWCGTLVFVYKIAKDVWKKTDVALLCTFFFSLSNLGQKFVATTQYEILLLFIISALFYLVTRENFSWKRSLMLAFLLTGLVAFHKYLLILGGIVVFAFYKKKVSKNVWAAFLLPLLLGGSILFSYHLYHNTKSAFLENWFSFRSDVRPNPDVAPRPLNTYSAMEFTDKYLDFLAYNYFRIPNKWIKENAAGYNFPYPELKGLEGAEFIKEKPLDYLNLYLKHQMYFWGFDRDIWYIDSYAQKLASSLGMTGECSSFHDETIPAQWCEANYLYGSKESNLVLSIIEIIFLIIGVVYCFSRYRFQTIIALMFIIVFMLPLFIVGGTIRFQIPILLILSLFKFAGTYSLSVYIYQKWQKRKKITPKDNQVHVECPKESV